MATATHRASTDQTGDEQLLPLSAAGAPLAPDGDGWPPVRSSLPRQRSPVVRPSMSSAEWGAPTPASLSPSSKFSTPTGLSNTAPAQRASFRLDCDFDPPFDWSDDSADDFPLIMPPDAAHDPSLDNQLLTALVENDFSSPSSYPSFLNPPADQASSQHRNATTNDPASASHTRRPSACPPGSPPRSALRTAAAPLNVLFTNDFDDQGLPPPGRAQAVEMASVPTSRDGLSPPDRAPVAKRRRLSGLEDGRALFEIPSLPVPPDDDDVFVDEKPGMRNDMVELATIDLTQANEVPEELKRPKVDNRVKISDFQCVVCMDDVTCLTVTHCGMCLVDCCRPLVDPRSSKATSFASNASNCRSTWTRRGGSAPCVVPRLT